jgi:hypothetical protein
LLVITAVCLGYALDSLNSILLTLVGAIGALETIEATGPTRRAMVWL